MKKYLKEILVLILQIFMFYIFPMFAGPTDAMGMVVLILLATFVLSIVIASVSNQKIKYFYPILVAVLFVPSVYIYYNESALIHTIWYLVDSTLGLLVGMLIHRVVKMFLN